ncbi:hypothetical protein MHUMG1_09305 [Metarhizium humberi]|uniref:O-methyltransferase C-terminal domain-containing protein n=1 Tax=Metarhizium humberi TaxID=2596975 RepID=A0A9P8S4C3_9HYPO|nr:hypothetical protein MHUMG1_09305 [Metarhizium humberi]
MSPPNANGLTNDDSNGLYNTSLPLEELSWTITKNASVVSQYLKAQQLLQPSKDAAGPSTIVPTDAPQHIQLARQSLMAAALEISQLAAGPSEFLPNLATGFQYISSLSWLCQYNIFHLVPLDSDIGYRSLSAAAHVSLQRLKSVIRMGMTAGLFRECLDGQSVKHSATSALLARDADVYAYAMYMSNGSARMAQEMAPAASRWGPDSTQPHETAFNIALATDLPFFEYLSRNPAEMQSFSAYMRNVRSSDGVALRHLVNGFAWDRIRDRGRVVDVGGSTGSAATALAEAFPHLRLVVQDLPANAERGRNMLQQSGGSIAQRITFQAHDFTKPQPVHGADVYLLRMILHDWPDQAAIGIVRKIIDAMDKNQPDARLLIMDTVLPKPGSVPVSVERILRARDLTMLQAFNSKERDLDDWKHLLHRADGNLALVNVVQPFGSAMSVLEVALGSSVHGEPKEGVNYFVAQELR